MGFAYAQTVAPRPIGMWTFDVRSNVVYGDAQMAFLFGIDDEAAAQGLPIERFFDAIHPDDIDRVQEEIALTYAGRPDFVSEYRVLSRDENWRLIQATGRCFYVDDEPVQYPGLVVEVETTRDRAKDTLAELVESVVVAKRLAASESREFIMYLLDMLLLELGRALASKQVDGLMPKSA